MNKRVRFLFLLLLAIALPISVLADDVSITNPLGEVTSFQDLLTKNIIPVVGGVIASLGTLMLLVAGILYVTSAGDPGRIETAKKALIYAIAGIFIGLLASVIPGIIKDALKGTGT